MTVDVTDEQVQHAIEAIKEGRGFPECLNAISPREADIVRLVVLKGKRPEDVAEIFQISIQEVEAECSAGLRSLVLWYTEEVK